MRTWPTAHGPRSTHDGETVLSYGPGGGYALLREWIAERHDVEPAQVVLTNGSLQGFQFVAELLAPTGRCSSRRRRTTGR